jgi:hypothetical protein
MHPRVVWPPLWPQLIDLEGKCLDRIGMKYLESVIKTWAGRLIGPEQGDLILA